MNRDNDKGKVLINRSLILGIGKFLLFIVIIARLYYLQVYQADKYKTLADENRISTRLLVPPRGIIYDRHLELLATNRQNFQALMVAEQAPNVQATLDAFKKIMPLSEAEEEKIKKDLRKNRSFVPIKIKDNLTWDEVAKIQLNAPDLPGIFIDEGLSRYYPYGEKWLILSAMFLQFRILTLRMIRCWKFRDLKSARRVLKNFMKKTARQRGKP